MITLDRKALDIKRFKLFNIIRVSIFLSLLFVSLLILLFLDPQIPIVPITILISVATVFNFLNFYFLQIFSFRMTVFFQIIFDILFITSMVYLSGGITSPFYFLYLLPILISANFLKRRDTILTASLSFVFFGTISELMYMEIIPTMIADYQSTISVSTFIYNLMMSFIAFLSISIAASFYFSNLRRTDEELKSVKKSLENLAVLNHTVIEKMEHGFITTEKSGKVISFNKRAQKLINVNGNENIKTLLNLDSERDLDAILFDQNTQTYMEKTLKGRTLNISISMVSNISTFGMIVLFLISDLTEKLEIETRLKEKEHLALIGEMAAGIAHEIRNPLASISGSVQFLKNEIELRDEHKNLMDIIIKESKRLSNSIEEFLNYTKSIALERATFDLSQLMDDTLELISSNNQSVSFIKRYNQQVRIYGDEKQIKQVIWNLISNAIKAVGENGMIEITIIETEPISLYIKDNGIGIHNEELEKIFLPFYSKFTAGIGLGMSIVKRILNEHGASIDIRSKKGHGTEIQITFEDNHGK